MQESNKAQMYQFIYLKLKGLNERLILMFIFASRKK